MMKHVDCLHLPRAKISRFPIYNELLRLGEERPGALYLDIGCGVGNDTRKVVADGFPASQIIASDLHPGELARGQSRGASH